MQKKHCLYALKQLRGTSASKALAYDSGNRQQFLGQKRCICAVLEQSKGEPRQCVCISGGIESGIVSSFYMENMRVFILLREKIISLPESYTLPLLYMALPSYANFLILRIIILLARIMHPIIASGSITQVRVMPKDWPSEAILILCLKCD
jgi:hypothetical protein